MKKLLLSFVSLFVLVLLVGCETNPSRPDPSAPTLVKKQEIKVLKVPAELLVRCKATHPPTRDEYVAADAAGREELLTTYSRELVTIIKNCDTTITTIGKWGDDQEKLILAPPTTP